MCGGEGAGSNFFVDTIEIVICRSRAQSKRFKRKGPFGDIKLTPEEVRSFRWWVVAVLRNNTQRNKKTNGGETFF